LDTIWNEMSDEMLEAIASVRESLMYNNKGAVMQTKQNNINVLLNDPLLKGKIRRNIWTGKNDIVGYTGWKRSSRAITETDHRYLYVYLEKFYQLNIERNADTAIDVVAAENPYHPILEYIESLEWDGQERIAHALHHFLGAEDDELSAACLRMFMLGALGRLYEPGSKFENMLCLVGGQGTGKSSFVRFLALSDEWFTDDLKHIDDENVYRKIQGHWIIEMAEMVGTANAKSVEDIKSFLSRQSDTYKVPYERYPVDRPRQCVFVGTTNKIRFLPLDRTGNRRFYPVMTDESKAEVHVLENQEASKEYMRQLWAEALVLYRAGERAFGLSKELEHRMNIRRMNFMAEDTETGMIQDWLDNCRHDYVCTKMLYNEAYHMYGEPDRKSVNVINDIMNNTIDGWMQGPQHRFDRYGQQRSWIRKNSEPDPAPDKMTEVPTDPEQTGLPKEWLDS